MNSFAFSVTATGLSGYIGTDFYTVGSAHPNFEQLQKIGV